MTPLLHAKKPQMPALCWRCLQTCNFLIIIKDCIASVSLQRPFLLISSPTMSNLDFQNITLFVSWCGHLEPNIEYILDCPIAMKHLSLPSFFALLCSSPFCRSGSDADEPK